MQGTRQRTLLTAATALGVISVLQSRHRQHITHRKEARVSGKATLHHINGETRAPSGG
jgi:hypothetical protein